MELSKTKKRMEKRVTFLLVQQIANKIVYYKI